MAKKKDELKYAEAISEIEEIIAEIEDSEPDVDDLVEKVKRAGFLLEFCKEKLHGAETEVTKYLDIPDKKSK
ncbi:MAG TPA: exodeoxyribonuclease VII small subunit [Bacteroidales bacterium]|nr:exodeoxyribonuclease VII small subunit [Bacteroidales bacterium]